MQQLKSDALVKADSDELVCCGIAWSYKRTIDYTDADIALLRLLLLTLTLTLSLLTLTLTV